MITWGCLFGKMKRNGSCGEWKERILRERVSLFLLIQGGCVCTVFIFFFSFYFFLTISCFFFSLHLSLSLSLSLSFSLLLQIADLAKEDTPQLYVACGRGPNSSLRVLRHGLEVCVFVCLCCVCMCVCLLAFHVCDFAILHVWMHNCMYMHP